MYDVISGEKYSADEQRRVNITRFMHEEAR
jgi:hypothetical protein